MDDTVELSGHGDADAGVVTEVNPLIHVVAPIVAVIGTVVVRKVVNTVYQQVTGHEPPLPRDPGVSFVRAALWTAVITTTAAVAEVAIYRAVNKIGVKSA